MASQNADKVDKKSPTVSATNEKKFLFSVRIADVVHPDIICDSIEEVMLVFNLYIPGFSGEAQILSIMGNGEIFTEISQIGQRAGFYSMVISFGVRKVFGGLVGVEVTDVTETETET
jgi:hypothetical protein